MKVAFPRQFREVKIWKCYQRKTAGQLSVITLLPSPTLDPFSKRKVRFERFNSSNPEFSSSGARFRSGEGYLPLQLPEVGCKNTQKCTLTRFQKTREGMRSVYNNKEEISSGLLVRTSTSCREERRAQRRQTCICGYSSRHCIGCSRVQIG